MFDDSIQQLLDKLTCSDATSNAYAGDSMSNASFGVYASSSSIFGTIFSDALKNGATEVYFEPCSNKVVLKYCIDSVWHNQQNLPLPPYEFRKLSEYIHSMNNVRIKTRGGQGTLHVNTTSTDFGEKVHVTITQ
jgi:type II secretory ATPase GspE/PulE/Tfp pilus assembly ATPase PilB-like protein